VRAGHTRLVLVLDAAALGAGAAALVVALGLPLAARRALGPQAVIALGVAVGLLVAGVGAVLLLRSVGRAVEKISELERVNLELLRARESLLRAERLATLGRIASGIAHEVGNPLGAISGYVELARDRLQRASSPHEIDDFLARIGAEVGRIDAIVRELLDLARPAEQVLGAIDLASPLDAALRLARVQARFRHVEVALDVAPELPKVIADERRLAQVFLNLLLNAGDAMAGAGRVSIRARSEDGGVVVRVEDSGPGIAPEDLPRVFEPFFTTKAPGHGTGLGLALSQGIVEGFGGRLGASNGAGGAVFTLELKAADVGSAGR
jgi:C4-dicarboxylate-specific signal transduction histidine kinase